MTDNQTHGIIPESLEFSVANDELLDALRAEAEFSVDQYGDLDAVLDKSKNGLAQFVGGFVGEETLFTLSNVAIYSDEQQFSALGADANFVSFYNKRGEIVLCVGLGSPSFRRILKSILGKSGSANASNQQLQLTRAEAKLYERFSNRLCLAFIRTLELKCGEFDAVQTEFKNLNKLALETDLIVFTYEVSFADAKFLISVLTTLDLLEPKHLGQQTDGVKTSSKPENASWSQKLSDKIDGLEVPLFAQLASKKMNLIDVAEFREGTRLDIEFVLKNINVTDAEENNLFLADVNFSESEVVFSIAGSSPNK